MMRNESSLFMIRTKLNALYFLRAAARHVLLHIHFSLRLYARLNIWNRLLISRG